METNNISSTLDCQCTNITEDPKESKESAYHCETPSNAPKIKAPNRILSLPNPLLLSQEAIATYRCDEKGA
jgi:hypothetical protein